MHVKTNVLNLALLLSIFFVFNQVVVLSAYEEAHKAKANIDLLSKKLHNNLEELENTYKKTKEEISKTIEELVVVKKLQDLLGQLTKGPVSGLLQCEYEYIVLDFLYKQSVMIETKSAVPAKYTISVQVNHKALVDEKKAAKDGDDLRVFYHFHEASLPVEIDRLVDNLYTDKTIVRFRTQKMIPANTVDLKSYALIFGGKSFEKPKANRRKVFAFYEDFDNSTLEGWERVWGEWIIKNGSLFGKTGRSPYGNGEVGLYLTQGKEWRDIEVELDLMETGTNVVYPGPFLRVQDSGLQHTTGWWFEYRTDHKQCTMRPFKRNNDGKWKYTCNLPKTLVKHKWFHFKYRVLGDKISHWADGVSIQKNVVVESKWMIPKGTIALGCHSIYRGSPTGCRTFYDNIRVRLAVESNPTVSSGDICHLSHHKDVFNVGEKERPGNSCKHIYDANVKRKKKATLKNGVYWIKTALQSKMSTQTFCDMEKGGWTLVGKISGRVGNIYTSWLVRNVNTDLLKSPKLTSGRAEYGCLDARLLAVKHSSEIMFSSGENSLGLGKKWVRWHLPSGREYSTWWNHGVGYARVKAAGTSQVTVRAWNGNSKVCYQNKYGIMPLQQHGGSYPYASHNKQGNTATNDYCMAVGVMLKGVTANDWSQNANGYDSPQSDSDWPNSAYNHQQPYLLVWLK